MAWGDRPRRVWRWIGRVDLAALSMALVLLALALASCFPQLTPAIYDDPDRLADWWAGMHARYGAVADWLMAAGLLRFFSSPGFLLLIGLLLVLTLICLLQRWPAVWRRAFGQWLPNADLVFGQAAHSARLTPPSGTAVAPVIKEALQRRNFYVRSLVHDTNEIIVARRNRLAWLSTLANHLAVPLLVAGALLTALGGWQEEVIVPPVGMVTLRHASDLRLANVQFVITRYPDGSVADYRATFSLSSGHATPELHSVRVNHPTRYAQVSFYLRGYQETAQGTQVTLLASYDPGYGLAIGAGALLLFGSVLAASCAPASVYARVAPDGTWQLAGHASRQAWEFEREFHALVGELAERFTPSW